MANTRNKVAIVFDGVVCCRNALSVGVAADSSPKGRAKSVLHKPCVSSCLSLWERCHAVAGRGGHD
ncbi:MAG: hypothetical protein FWH14_08875 [Oscillospiraceae bacterium]|nr:hypothetical protein [Oscillospiraceae bacterium]